MRRADRLFQVVQLLRSGRIVTAGELAAELEVSERTIYRDVRDLASSGVPIQGEAGVGYCLPHGFDLPPLMFTEGELEALVLGVRMVESWGGPELARSARQVLSKVETALPDRLRGHLGEVGLFVPAFHVGAERTQHLEPLRRGVVDRRKLSFGYARADGERSTRTVRPLALYFWGTTWTLLAWCELRADFRTFRPDRMQDPRLLDDAFELEEGKDLTAFLRRQAAECADRDPPPGSEDESGEEPGPRRR